MRSTRPPATATRTTGCWSTRPRPRASPRRSWTASSGRCCARCSGPTSAGCPTTCPYSAATTTTPPSTPCTSPGPVRPRPGRRTTTGCRGPGCSSSGTTPSAGPTTRTRCGATPSPTSASTCWPGTGRRCTPEQRARSGLPRLLPAVSARRLRRRSAEGGQRAGGDVGDRACGVDPHQQPRGPVEVHERRGELAVDDQPVPDGLGGVVLADRPDAVDQDPARGHPPHQLLVVDGQLDDGVQPRAAGGQ